MTDETKAAVPGDQAQGPVWRKWRRTLFTRDEKGKLYFAGILIFLVGFVLYLTGMIVIPRIPEWFCVGKEGVWYYFLAVKVLAVVVVGLAIIVAEKPRKWEMAVIVAIVLLISQDILRDQRIDHYWYITDHVTNVCTQNQQAK